MLLLEGQLQHSPHDKDKMTFVSMRQIWKMLAGGIYTAPCATFDPMDVWLVLCIGMIHLMSSISTISACREAHLYSIISVIVLRNISELFSRGLASRLFPRFVPLLLFKNLEMQNCPRCTSE
jgi:hypothetical protein